MIKKLDLFDILILLSIIFVGTDVWAINVGVNIRFIQIFYIGVAVYLVLKGKYRFYINKYFFVFLLSASLSVVFSIYILNSLLYYIWIIYDFVILIPIIYCYIIEKGPKQFLKLIKYAFRIVLGLILIQFIIDGIFHIELPFLSSQHHLGVTRPALWFYEPSYLASFMLIYLTYTCYMLIVKREYIYIIDTILTILALIAITSTTGFLGIVIVLALCFILFIAYSNSARERIYAIVFAITAIAILFLGIRLFFPHMYELFIGRIFTNGLAAASGDRISSYSKQIDAFLANPLVGVGLDSFGAFIGDPSAVATNITLELLACSGIIGALSFYTIIFLPIFKAFFGHNRKKYVYSKPLCLCLFVLIIILQANQNYMRLYLWLLIIACYASIEYETNGYKPGQARNEYFLL